MKETLRHQEAFDYYYSLGDTRRLLLVSQKAGVAEATAKRWSTRFKWRSRIAERDKKNALKLQAKTDKTILKTKSDYHKEVQESLSLIRGALALVAKKVKDQVLKADSAKDLGTLIKAQDAAIRLEQLLSGEADSRPENKLIIEYRDPVPRARPVESEVVENV
ncbi:hypothetical protein LCGC14_0553760 [marine sediment metagenome]|uniref:Terminase small subunit n=1 Tax=marine sediment metagenome TaxID=412755 RepID=A0A0F9UAL3_9ZZZZ